MEFLQSHTNVTHQPMFDSGQYGGFNPYALGFGIMQDISCICVDPQAEDRMWFPDIAGAGNPDAVTKDIWENSQYESFITKFHHLPFMRHRIQFTILENENEQH